MLSRAAGWLGMPLELSTSARASNMNLYQGQVHVDFGKISGTVPAGVRDPLQETGKASARSQARNSF